MLVFATARHNLAHFDIIRTKNVCDWLFWKLHDKVCDQIKRAQMNVWKCCVFPSSSSAARSEHPQLQQGTVVSCQCTHNQIFISRDEEKRGGRRSKHEKYNKTEEKKKEFGNWWRVREEEANRKKRKSQKDFVCCRVSELSGRMTPRVSKENKRPRWGECETTNKPKI